jgi:hypothetical protein
VYLGEHSGSYAAEEIQEDHHAVLFTVKNRYNQLNIGAYLFCLCFSIYLQLSIIMIFFVIF